MRRPSTSDLDECATCSIQMMVHVDNDLDDDGVVQMSTDELACNYNEIATDDDAKYR